MLLQQLREQLFQRADNRLHQIQPLQNMRLQFLALALAAGNKFVHRWRKQPQHRFLQGIAVHIGADNHIGKLQNIGNAELAQIAVLFAPFAVQLGKLVHQILVDVQAVCAVGDVAQLDAAFDFAARNFAANDFAHRAFQYAQIVGDFELHV